MRRVVILAAMALGALAIPSSALATHGGSNCTYAGGQQVTSGDLDPGAGEVYVYSGSGSSGQADTAAGACANTNTAAADFEGGTAEAGTGTAPGGSGTYAVIDGDNDNVDPQGQSDGYFGVSSFETGNKTSPAECTATGPDDPSQPPPAPSSNSGGCVGADNVGWVDVSGTGAPTPICGNTSGNTWDSTNRDGCSIP